MDLDKGPLNRGKLVLRLAYWHECRESLEHRVALHKICGDYIRRLNQKNRLFPWNCKFVPLEYGTPPGRISAVHVDFFHEHYTAAKTRVASIDVQRLWAHLAKLPEEDEFRNLFGGKMICINIYPVDTEHREPYINGELVQNLSVRTETTVQVEPDLWDSVADTIHGSYLKSCEIVKILKTFVKPHKDSGQTSGNEVYNVEETAERFNEAMNNSFRDFEAGRQDRNRTIEQIGEVTVVAKREFDKSFDEALTQVDKVRNAKNLSGEAVWDAIISMRKILLLFSGLEDNSKKLMDLLKSKQDNTNNIIGAVGGVVALTAIGFFFGAAMWPSFVLYSWVPAGATSVKIAGAISGTIGAAGGITAPVKSVRQNASRKKAKQLRAAFQNSIENVYFLIAACWLEKIWFMKFHEIPLCNKERFFKKLGINISCFENEELRMALIDDKVNQMKSYHTEIKQQIDALFKDLNITIRETAR